MQQLKYDYRNLQASCDEDETPIHSATPCTGRDGKFCLIHLNIVVSYSFFD